MSDIIEVKVIKVPGAVKDIAVEAPATVGDALSAAGIEVQENESMKLNGNDCTRDDAINTGDRLVVAKGAKGNEGDDNLPVAA